MDKPYRLGRNQYSDRPPFCDFLERYQAANAPGWEKSHLRTQRVGMGRFDEWLKVVKVGLGELDWQKLLEFYRFLAAQGLSPSACTRSVQVAKHALRWGIDKGELPQRLEDLYTLHYSRHSWDHVLPTAAQDFLALLEVTHPASHRLHAYALRVFHSFLEEKKLTYRRLKSQHMTSFLRFLHAKGFTKSGKVNILTKVRSFTRWLFEQRRIRRHPDELMPSRSFPKKPVHLPRPLDPALDQELQKLLIETGDIYYKAILLLRWTGMRIRELQELPFHCIVYDFKKRPALQVPPIKLGIERLVPLDPEAVHLVGEIQKMSFKNYKRNREPRRLVIGARGTPPRYERYSYIMTELCARLNTRKWINLHALRHTYATSMLNAGMSLPSLQKLLGHKTIVMTLAYAKLAGEKLHSDFAEAQKHLNRAQIPHLLVPKVSNLSATLIDLAAGVNKLIDVTEDLTQKKRLKQTLNTLAKIKMTLLKAQNEGHSL